MYIDKHIKIYINMKAAAALLVAAVGAVSGYCYVYKKVHIDDELNAVTNTVKTTYQIEKLAACANNNFAYDKERNLMVITKPCADALKFVLMY